MNYQKNYLIFLLAPNIFESSVNVVSREMLELGLGREEEVEGSETLKTNCLVVEQGRVLDEGGSLKVTYPSKTDLNFEKTSFTIVRQ